MKHAGFNSFEITLPAEQMERLDEAVRSGDYGSKDEIVIEALRLWHERNILDAIDDEYLKRQYEAGLASGEAVAVTVPELLARFKADRHAGG